MAVNAASAIDNYKMILTTKYADFSGRARRSEYWQFSLVNVVIAIVLAILGAMFAQSLFSLLSTVFGLAVFIPGLAAAIRRLHDTGKSGWFLLIAIIPLIGIIILLVFMFTDSTRGSNDYGPSPKYGA